MSRGRFTRRLGRIGMALLAAAAGQARLAENVAPRALAIPSNYPNPINDGKPLVFDRAPEFADGNPATGYRLICDQPGRLEFYFDPAHPVSPGRCEVLTQMEKITAGRVEILRTGKWTAIAQLRGGEWTATAEWTPEPVCGVAVVVTGTTDLDHEPVRVMEVRLLAADTAEAGAPAPRLMLTTTRAHHVFALGEEVQVQCALDGPAEIQSGRTLHWRWTDFVNDAVDAGGDEPCRGPAVFRLRPTEQGPLLVKAWLSDDRTGAVLAATTLLVGVRDPDFPGHVKPLRPQVERPQPTRAEITGKMIWGAELYHRMLSAQFKAAPAPLAAFRDGGLNLVAAYQELAWFEPLPGVFNFAALDSVVQTAEAHGLGVELGLWRWYYGSPGLDGPGNLQYWLEPFSALQRDGSKGARWLNAPSLSSPEFRASARRATEVFLRRYRGHPSVWIWHVHPFGVIDHDFISTSEDREAPLDYSPAAARDFAQFLRDKYGEVGVLNAAYSTTYPDFSAVPLPGPLVRDIADVREAVATFDHRRNWRDYLEFRDRHSVHGFERELYTLLRRLDPERPIGGMSNTMANSAVPEELELRAAFGRYYGDQNTETPAFIRRYLGTAGGRLPFRGEDHSPINPRRFSGDLRARMNEFFFNCATVGVRQLNFVFPVWEQNPAWAMFASPDLREAFAFNAATAVVPSEAGLLHSFTSGSLEGFTAYAFIELHRWLDLLAWSGVAVTPGRWLEPVMADGPLGDGAHKALLIDNDSRLLEPAMIAALVHYVEQGGHLVLQRTSGEFAADNPQPAWPLLRALGYPALAGLRVPFAREAVADGAGVLAGVSLPLRDVAEIDFPGATPVAFFGGRPVAAVWPRGRGQVLLLGGTIGDYALAGSRRRLLENIPGAMRSFPAQQEKRTAVLRALTARLQVWAGVELQGIQSDSPVEVILRRGAAGTSIALRNPGAESLAQVKLRVPGVAASGVARVTYAGKVETVPVRREAGFGLIELTDVPAGAFCLVQMTADGSPLPGHAAR